MNTISSYPLFSGFSGSFLDKILVTYSFQPDLEDFVQHLSITPAGFMNQGSSVGHMAIIFVCSYSKKAILRKAG